MAFQARDSRKATKTGLPFSFSSPPSLKGQRAYCTVDTNGPSRKGRAEQTLTADAVIQQTRDGNAVVPGVGPDDVKDQPAVPVIAAPEGDAAEGDATDVVVPEAVEPLGEAQADASGAEADETEKTEE